MLSVYTAETPIGMITIKEQDGQVVRIYLPGQDAPPACSQPQTDAAAQLAEYFAGRRSSFTVPMKPEGTPFFLRVWQAAQTIPYGGTLSYGALAELAGRPLAVRACGQAMARNPLPLLIPCHRVIYSHGNRQSYLGGEEMKKFLLKLEAESSQTE